MKLTKFGCLRIFSLLQEYTAKPFHYLTELASPFIPGILGCPLREFTPE
ncbi:MAG: hypothetical protein O8C64_01995 [Candidatus Methanoperedens sp.]|nr:hypothetical protein [Candidatus Methanoperedens sp.]